MKEKENIKKQSMSLKIIVSIVIMIFWDAL